MLRPRKKTPPWPQARLSRNFVPRRVSSLATHRSESVAATHANRRSRCSSHVESHQIPRDESTLHYCATGDRAGRRAAYAHEIDALLATSILRVRRRRWHTLVVHSHLRLDDSSGCWPACSVDTLALLTSVRTPSRARPQRDADSAFMQRPAQTALCSSSHVVLVLKDVRVACDISASALLVLCVSLS